MTKGIPAGSHSLTPHLVLSDAAAAIEFYKKAFGAEEGCRMEMPGTGKIMHAQIQIGDSRMMLADEMNNGECRSQSPLSLGGTPVVIHLYVENVDEVYKKAVAAGAKEIMPPADMFWGDRYSQVQDPFGHKWSIATHVRDLTPEEVKKGAEACFKQAAGQPA